MICLLSTSTSHQNLIKMNPLLTGSVDDISNMLGNLVESGGDNAIWAGRAMSMMNALLSCLLPLRDSSELYDPIRVSSQYKKRL